MTKEELVLKIRCGEKVSLKGADLSGANLSGADLGGSNLSRANLRGADLGGSNLSWANFSRANLSGANFSRANLSGANLSGADLGGSNLSRANLRGANLRGANLREAKLSGANLIGVIFDADELKARKRLQQIVSMEQYKEYIEHGYFEENGAEFGLNGLVIVDRFRYCASIYSPVSIPETDKVIHRLLLWRRSKEEFHKTANII